MWVRQNSSVLMGTPKLPAIVAPVYFSFQLGRPNKNTEIERLMFFMMACDQGRGDNLPPPSYGQVAGMSLSPRWRVPILSSPAAT